MNHRYNDYRNLPTPWDDDGGPATLGQRGRAPCYPAPAPVSPITPPAIRSKRPWTRHAVYAAMIVGGNLIFHLYCQNWQLVDQCRGHYTMLPLVIVLAGAALIKAVLHFNPDDLDPPIVALPSVAAGIFGIIALLASMPGLEGWIGHPRGGVLLGDFELLFVPFATILQLILVVRDYRTARPGPVWRPVVSHHSPRSPQSPVNPPWADDRPFRGDNDIPF